ncbi:MAG TPA: hypothetical protein VHO25_23275, partial [Polyangiaceae bacterium]|nr:hypothetical protein [Polyangiaceae bacterium]
VCNELMNRHNFGKLSGVIVDVCVHHGVWFDDGELAQVLSFCSSGQLPDVEKLERFLRVGHQRPKVTPLDFKDTSTRAGREREAVDIVLDVLWSLLLLFP